MNISAMFGSKIRWTIERDDSSPKAEDLNVRGTFVALTKVLPILASSVTLDTFLRVST